MKTIAYLCLQATHEGQASYAHVHEIVRGLRRRQWNVALFEPSYAGRSKPTPVWRKLIEFWLVQVRLVFALRQVDALYIRWHPAVLFSVMMARLFRIPVIQEINGPYEDVFIAYKWLAGIRRPLIAAMRWSLVLSQGGVVVTAQLGDWMRTQGFRGKLAMIPNGANIDLFNPDAKSAEFDQYKPYALFFGALAAWQGIDTLLASVGDAKWPEGVRLLIAGDGQERVKVEAAVKQSQRICYLGKVDYKRMPALVAGSLVGISPQNNIGNRSATGLFPLKVFETMACGVPVIVSDFPGVAEIVKDHGVGTVIPPDTPHELAQAVSSFAGNQGWRDGVGLKARILTVANHSWDAMAGKTADFILEMTHG